jgi:seryl-tRNA synthetase
MLDLHAIRDDPKALDKSLQRRGEPVRAQQILQLDTRHREILQKVESLRQQKKQLAETVFKLRQDPEQQKEITQKAKEVKAALETAEDELHEAHHALLAQLNTLPNILADDVPDGENETHNVCLEHWGKKPTLPSPARCHDDLGKALGMDFDAAARMSGSRFVFLRGSLARIERALAQFMLDNNQSQGFEEVSPPYLMNEKALYGAGQLPKFAQDAFCTTDNRWLLPTAEVPLINFVRETTLKNDQLPLRLTAYTPCFRSEAGAAGRDTRGLIRLHQFSKVELVSITAPNESAAEFEHLRKTSEKILQRLELPYRRVYLSSGDTGFAAQKTYDLEVWMPAQKTYREIASISHCGDFQARRIQARFRGQQGEKGFVHTLNGSALPAGRTLAAILENYQQADGSVLIPQALRPYLDNCSTINPTSDLKGVLEL